MTLQDAEKGWGGVYSLLLTPYHDDLSIDYDLYGEYVRWQVAQGVHHLFSVCGSSEMTSLTLEERLQCARVAVKNSCGHKVVATANLEPSRPAQIEEIKRMEDTGVDGLVFITKSYGCDDEIMVRYITELAEHAAKPILLYEFPGYPNNKISAAAYGKLVSDGIVQGIKDTTCIMEGGISDKIRVQGESCVMQANIPYLLESYEQGARGVIATPSTCGVGILRKMWDAYLAGDMAKATEYHADVCALSDVTGSGFPASAKYLVSLQGIPMQVYTRGGAEKHLNAQGYKNLRVWHDAAVRKGLMEA